MNTKNNNKEVYKSIKIKISGIPKGYIMGDSTGDYKSGYYRQDLSFPDKETARKYLAKVKVTLPNSYRI